MGEIMAKKKEEVKKVVKEVKKKDPEITQDQVNSIWNVIEEIQSNLNNVNDKLTRVLNRMGLEWSKQNKENQLIMKWKPQ